jgi:hypothetical protein
VVILLMLPSNVLTYRAEVFSLKILKEVKRNKNKVTSEGYNNRIHYFNVFFKLWPPYDKL